MKTIYALLFCIFLLGSQLAVNAQTLGFYGPYHTHLAEASTNLGHATYLSDPSVDNNPDALVFVTANFSVDNIFVNIYSGIWYNGAEWSIYDETEGSSIMIENSGWNVGVIERGGSAYIHEATAENIEGNYSNLDSPGVTDNANALVFITHNWSGNASGVYVNRATGVWYNGSNWAIYNEDQEGFQVEAAFNTFVADPSEHAFQHVATEENTNADLSYIDHPLLNGNPDARILITHNWGEIGQAMNIYNTSPNAVLYDVIEEQWVITNENLMAIDPNTTFNVLILNLLPGETCSMPLPIDCTMGSVTGSTIGVPNDVESADANECESVGDGGQIWYSFEATEDALVTISTCSSIWDTRISVFSGSCGGFICAGSDDDSCNESQSSLEFQAVEGETYMIYMGGYSDYEGEFVLDISCVPNVGVEESAVNSDFAIYPNPARNSVTVELSISQSEQVLIQLIDMTGRVVVTENISGDKPVHSLDISAVANGIYSLNMTQSNRVLSKQLVIAH